ncbi:hypothetical protein IFM89_017509 [Coptis chinensis]|uniref:Uncharacterized protein n=1 Tax=Coptis chinensis TaxID=261450 RepID=A0A835HT73_9MAGN|nr:hypothetical protein IFM89_017509 [Coptis chinensis]
MANVYAAECAAFTQIYSVTTRSKARDKHQEHPTQDSPHSHEEDTDISPTVDIDSAVAENEVVQEEDSATDSEADLADNAPEIPDDQFSDIESSPPWYLDWRLLFHLGFLDNLHVSDTLFQSLGFLIESIGLQYRFRRQGDCHHVLDHQLLMTKRSLQPLIMRSDRDLKLPRDAVDTADKASLVSTKPTELVAEAITNNWTGITCENITNRVVSVNLSGLNLSGLVDPSLCNLKFLEVLDVGCNMFHGVVPDQLMSVNGLRELVLKKNEGLGGFVPKLIGNFSDKLEKIDISFCSFQGDVPDSLFYLKSLKYIDLSNNLLSGTLRDFEQPIEYLNLASNGFSGTLPCFSSSVESLTVINLANNSIIGGIPTCIASLHGLRELNVSYNELEYQVPPRLIFSEKLLVLDLSHNDFSGVLPSIIAETSEKSGLVLLDLSHNRFSGEIPIGITELKSLQGFFLSNNLLSGEIPARIGNLTYLQAIDLSYNLLSGPIPLNIVGCFQLLELKLSNNNLSGTIQPELDALDSLKILDVSNNKFSGEIPLTLAGCRSLEVVDLSSNNLAGELNEAILKWTNLRFLSLAHNNFNGALPYWLFSFEGIQFIDLSCNNFSGFIPEGNFNISSSFNNRKRTTYTDTDSPLHIRAVANVENHELRFEYYILSSVGIDLSGNFLSGEIPEGLFGLQGMEYLNLSYNSLVGQISTKLEKMRSLKTLDLSHNSLTGQIPANISGLQELLFLNLSYNCLSGFVPKNQRFWRFPGAFAGNPNLCVAFPGEGCQTAKYPVGTGDMFEERKGGLISVWAFGISSFVSFYVSVVVIFCSAPMRSYIFQPLKSEF